jgi:hypothetical protein
MSAHDTYVLRATQSGWTLLLNGQTVGSFERWPEAERAGMIALESARQMSRSAELFRQDRSGEPTLISKTGLGLIGNVVLRSDRPGGGAAHE